MEVHTAKIDPENHDGVMKLANESAVLYTLEVVSYVIPCTTQLIQLTADKDPLSDGDIRRINLSLPPSVARPKKFENLEICHHYTNAPLHTIISEITHNTHTQLKVACQSLLRKETLDGLFAFYVNENIDAVLFPCHRKRTFASYSGE